MVTLQINGKRVDVEEGTTVLAAARQAGIFIPTLCAHPALRPSGGCRLCVVEVEGTRGPQTACTTPVRAGMVVATDTPALHENRQAVLSMLFGESNHLCPYCPVNAGDCELQGNAYREGMTHWPLIPAWMSRPVDASAGDFIYDSNRCILCRRCVRACGELVGNFTLGVSQRGARTRLVADGGVPLGESACVACGTCVQVCPTGALYERRFAYQGYGPAAQATASLCVGCSLGCGLKAVVRAGRLVRVDGDWASPVSGGLLCQAGRFEPVAEARERLLTPLLRRDGRLAPAGWDEALRAAADGLRGAAGLISTRLPVESLAAFRRLMVDGLHSALVTSTEEGRTAAGLDAQAHAAGLAALHAADLVIVWGVDLGRSHQVAGFLIKRRLPGGLKLVVIDPRATSLASRAEHLLRPTPGADARLLQAWLAALAPGAVESEVRALAEQAGVAGEDVAALVRAVAAARQPVVVYGKGLTADQPEAVGRLQALARATGHLQLLSVRGGANSRAAEVLGLDRRFRPAAGVPVFVDLGDDYASARLLAAVQAASFLAVAASYRSPLADRADVVLPVATWAEQAGHYLNLEGRLQAAHAALAVPDGVRANLDALAGLAQRLGVTLDADWRAAFQPPAAMAEAAGVA